MTRLGIAPDQPTLPLRCQRRQSKSLNKRLVYWIQTLSEQIGLPQDLPSRCLLVKKLRPRCLDPILGKDTSTVRGPASLDG